MLSEALGVLPPEWPHSLLPKLRSRRIKAREKVVVVDDDPTGAQTVHDVSILTRWSTTSLRSELADDSPAFFLLSNSRSLPLAEARALNKDIGLELAEASRTLERRLVVISRSDSTLRGHFPGEMEALEEGLGGGFDAWFLIPFFREGHRYTIGDIHYAAEDGWLVPVGGTDYAKDATFGYSSSNLKSWVEEKTEGRVRAEDVTSISLEEIRLGGPSRVAELVLGLRRGSVCVVNAASLRDLEVFTLGVSEAEAKGRRYLYRTAASFVQVRIGQGRSHLLTRRELKLSGSEGGLVVVGSHVPKSTAQLESLLKDDTKVAAVEVDAETLLDENGRADEISRVVRLTEARLSRGEDVVVFTSRKVLIGGLPDASLTVAQKISDGVAAVVHGISRRPRYVLTKGGVTSADIATKALGVRRAFVLGQIAEGVPVWRLGPESRFPGLAYLIFPGNVGGLDALTEVVEALGLKTGTKGSS